MLRDSFWTFNCSCHTAEIDLSRRCNSQSPQKATQMPQGCERCPFRLKQTLSQMVKKTWKHQIQFIFAGIWVNSTDILHMFPYLSVMSFGSWWCSWPPPALGLPTIRSSWETCENRRWFHVENSRNSFWSHAYPNTNTHLPWSQARFALGAFNVESVLSVPAAAVSPRRNSSNWSKINHRLDPWLSNLSPKHEQSHQNQNKSI